MHVDSMIGNNYHMIIVLLCMHVYTKSLGLHIIIGYISDRAYTRERDIDLHCIKLSIN